MKIIGAAVKYDVGNRSETVIFDEVHPCMSLKDKTITAEFRGISQKIDPGVVIVCPKQFIEWALHDAMSPFLRDESFVVAWDDGELSVDKARAEREKKFAAVKAEKALPDGLPTKDWKPKQLMDLFRALDAKDIDERGFIVMTPPGKARRLAEYMQKNGISLKDGAISKAANAA